MKRSDAFFSKKLFQDEEEIGGYPMTVFNERIVVGEAREVLCVVQAYPRMDILQCLLSYSKRIPDEDRNEFGTREECWSSSSLRVNWYERIYHTAEIYDMMES